MVAYRITLHDHAGGVVEERSHAFDHDDAAIDFAGALEHPHAIRVWRSERLIAEFPPLGAFPSSHG